MNAELVSRSGHRPQRLMRRTAVAALLAAVPMTPLVAQPVLYVDEAVGEYRPARWSEVLEDPTGELTIDDVSSGPASREFRPSPLPALRPGPTRSTWWIRMSLQAARSDGQWLLEIENALIDRVMFFSAATDGHGWQAIAAGSVIPFAQRPIDHRNVVFPLAVSAEEPTTFYLRVEAQTVRVPLWLGTQSAFVSHARQEYVFLSFFLGAMTVVAVYGLFLAWLLRSRTYLWFALFNVCSVLVTFLWEGLGHQFLSLARPGWLLPAAQGVLLSNILFGVLFVQRLFTVRSRHPRMHRVMWIAGLLSMAGFALSPIGDLPFYYVVPFLAYLACKLAIAVLAWRRGDSTAHYLMFAMGLGATAFFIGNLGLATESIPLATSVSILRAGSLIYSALMAFGLAARVRSMAEARQREAVAARDAEARAEAAEAASTAKSEVLADMSHQIRTPLNAIMGFTQILRRGDRFGGDDRRALQNIENGGVRLLSVVDDVLDLAKVEARRVELHADTFLLRRTLGELQVMFQPRCVEKGVQWTLAAESADGGPVCGDEDKLSQVLGILLSNAVKFTDSGEVSLRVECGDELADDRYRFVVADTGVGISDEDRDRIFEPFGQTPVGEERGGAGIGLSIARRLVQLMGGTLTLLPSDGTGTRFAVELPLPPAVLMAEPATHREPWRAPVERQLTALVVDDDAASREVLGTLLGQLGVRAELAADGAEGLQRVQQRRPDVVFMDIRLPEDDGGVWAQRMWHAVGSELKIVATSGSVLAHQRSQYREQGFQAVLDKPILLERLSACLRELFGEPTRAEDDELAAGSGVVEVPSDLLYRMRSAAELASVTDLKRHLDELSRLDAPGTRSLAERLLAKTQALEMDSVLTMLQRVVVQKVRW